MHWTRGGFPTPISSYQGAFIHHRSLAGAASGAPSEARPAKAFATILFICEDGGRMARRRILERGTVRQINSAAGGKKTCTHPKNDGVVVIGLFCFGNSST